MGKEYDYVVKSYRNRTRLKIARIISLLIVVFAVSIIVMPNQSIAILTAIFAVAYYALGKYIKKWIKS